MDISTSSSPPRTAWRCLLRSSSLFVAAVASACAAASDHEAVLAKSALADPQLCEAEVRSVSEFAGDRLGVHFFPAREGAGGVTTFWFPGTVSSGLVDIEPWLGLLRGLGDVYVFDRQVSSCRSFESLAALHARAIQKLRDDGRVAGKSLVVAHSYGAQVAMRTVMQLAWPDDLGDTFGAIFLEPCLGPRSVSRGEVPESDRKLVGWAKTWWVPWATIRAFTGQNDVAVALSLQNPDDEIPPRLVDATLASFELEHGLEQGAALTIEELGWTDRRERGEAIELCSYCKRFARRSLAVLGSRDPYYTVETQGEHAYALGISMPDEPPECGHHGHFLRFSKVAALVKKQLGVWHWLN